MTPMSAAAERSTSDNAVSSRKSRRREHKRKVGRGVAESVQRRAVQVVAVGVGVVLLLLIGASAARALRPDKSVEPPNSPVALAGSMQLRETERLALPSAAPLVQPPGPQPPVFVPPPSNNAADDDAPPPPKNDPPKPEPAPDLKPKADDPAPKPPAPPVPPPPSSRQYKGPSEFELLRQLSYTQDVGLTPLARQQMASAYQTDYQASARLAMRPMIEPSTLLSYFPDAKQLPLRGALTCQLPPKEAETLGILSKKLHLYINLIAPFDPKTGKRQEPVKLREVLRAERRGKRPEWLRPEAVPALVQILMHEDVPLRVMLVDLLSEIEGPAAT